MEIGAPELLEVEGDVRYRTPVLTDHSTTDLWYSVQEKYANLLSGRSDAALVGLLIPAMAAGDEIRISGTVSEVLHRNLSGPLQEILIQVVPGLKLIDIHAEQLTPSADKARGVATGFSAGVDAFITLRDYYYQKPPADLRLTHLTFFNVGSHFWEGEALFHERLVAISEAAHRIGLPLVPVNSNLDSFYDVHTYQQTLTLRNIAAAYVLQGGIGTYLHSSGQLEEDQRIAESESVASADIFVLPQLSTDALEAIPAGGEYNRVDKTLLVPEIEESYESLHVCNEVMGFENCCRCQKCLRAMLTLEIGGYLSRYASRFDLDLYASQRSRFIAQVHFFESIYNPEIIELIAERKFKLPLSSRLYIYLNILHLERLGRRIVRKVKNITRQ